MPIKQRLVQRMPDPEYRDGYPDILFEGFRMRFGQVNAIFSNANMQSIAGLADPAINRMHVAGAAPIPTAATLFFSKDGLEKEVARRKALGLKYDFLHDIWKQFPINHIPGEVRNRIGEE